MTETGSPIKEFIEKTREQAIAGLGDWELKAPIELELNTIVSGKAGGGIDISVINFGAKVEAEQQQKIRIVIGPRDQEAESAKIAEAKFHKVLAEKRIEQLEKGMHPNQLAPLGNREV